MKVDWWRCFPGEQEEIQCKLWDDHANLPLVFFVVFSHLLKLQYQACFLYIFNPPSLKSSKIARFGLFPMKTQNIGYNSKLVIIKV